MAQANVISALKHDPLRPFLFPCSISSSTDVDGPSAAKRRTGHAMKRVENRQNRVRRFVDRH